MVKLYVEGGGDSKYLHDKCRWGFRKFLENAGLRDNMPRIVASGGRGSAYGDYCAALQNKEKTILLVDSESPVLADCQQGDPKDWKPWQHLKNREGDQWDKPDGAEDTDCHLMVHCMEAWFLADRDTLKQFFGQGFNANALPAIENGVESIPKKTIYDSLSTATKPCKIKAKSRYGKGEHSFAILEKLDATKVMAASPWAKRLVDVLKTVVS